MGQRSLRILIIDESAVRAAILEEGLRVASGEQDEALEIHYIRDMANLLARIVAIDPDVILIDLENPSRDTLEQMFQVSRLAQRRAKYSCPCTGAACSRATREWVR